jgi:hypothetical protein
MRTGGASDGRKGGALKVNPMDDCYRRVRHERLLGKSADANDAFRTGWVPTTSTVHPEHPNAALGCGWRVFACASSYFTDDQRKCRSAACQMVRASHRRRCNVGGEPTPASVRRASSK